MSDETLREQIGSDAMVREGQLQETVREGYSVTTREGDGAVIQGAQGSSARLPERVRRAGYEWVRDLDVVGGEADVSVIRRSGVEYFFKHYHRGMHPNEDVLRVLREEGNRAHVVEIVDYSADPRDAWEIHEYCPLGTIGRGLWASSHPFPHKPETIQAILTEMSEAIHHIHHMGDGVAHRDIKPSNILIRSAGEEETLDLVLTDFGVARDDQAATHRTTFAGTNLYAAPEAHEGKSSKESDWFALGAIVFELLTGRKLLANAEDQIPSARSVVANCLTGHYYDNVSGVAFPDGRWEKLVKGLVTYDREFRWGYGEIAQWLDFGSEDPEPHWELPRSGYAGISLEQCYQPSWSNELVVTLEQLARSLGENWDAAKRGLAGREANRIKHFLGNFPDSGRVVQIIDASMPTERKLVALQLMLDPGNPPRFDGRTLETSTLRAGIDAADRGDEGAKAWLLGVVRSEALVSYGEHRQDGRTSEAGRRLKIWFDQAEKVTESVPEDKRALANAAFADALPELFELAFGRQEQ